MQAILITFDQAYYERIIDMLQRNNCRGFTSWQEVQGRGTNDGSRISAPTPGLRSLRRL